MTKEEFRLIAREGAKLTHLTDQQLDQMYEDALRATADYRKRHPAEWAASDEQAQQRARQQG